MVTDNIDEEEDKKSLWKGSDNETNFTDGCSTSSSSFSISPSGFSNSQVGCSTSPSGYSNSRWSGDPTHLTYDTGTESGGTDGNISSANRDFATAFTDINDETFFIDDDDAGSSIRTPSVGSFSVQTPLLQSRGDDENISIAERDFASAVSEINETFFNDGDAGSSVQTPSVGSYSVQTPSIQSSNTMRTNVQKIYVPLVGTDSKVIATTGNESTGNRMPTKLSSSAKPPVSPTKLSRTPSISSSRKSSVQPSRNSSKVSHGFKSRPARSISPGIRGASSKTSSNNSLSRLRRSKSKAEAKLSGNKSFSSQSGIRLSSSVPRGKSKSIDKKDKGHAKNNKRRSLFRSRSRSSSSQGRQTDSPSRDATMDSRVEDEGSVVDPSVQSSICDVTEAPSRDSTNIPATTPLNNHVERAPVVTYENGCMRQTTKGPKFMRNINVSKQDLRLRQKAEKLLINQDYEGLATIVQENPKVVRIQASQPLGRTLLHIIANESNPVPENILLKIISHDTSVASIADNSTNTPLHYAASRLRRENMHVFIILLKFHPSGVSCKNAEGDLPLHLAAANPTRCAHEAIRLLLEMYSKGITQPNKNGQIPLHLALTEGSNNPKNMQTIVQFHKNRKAGVSVLDNKGHSPLHSAIRDGTRYECIQAFNDIARDSFIAVYTKEDENGYLPLHTALFKKDIDPLILLSLIHAAPFTGGMPSPTGEMPIVVATKYDMSTKIIQSLLASDLPIELGNRRGTTSGMGTLVERDHGYSWWHVAVECRGKYVDAIYSFLSEKASFIQIIALARSIGPDNKTLTIHAASASLEASIRHLLRFFYRYELSANRLPVVSSEVQSFSAIDHGEELETLKVTGPWLQDGFTSIEGYKGREASENAHEVSYLPWQTKNKDVMLRCYVYDDAYEAELSIRQKYNLSSDFVERIIHCYRVNNYVNASFSTGNLLCIVYERNDSTLYEMLNDKNSNQRNWIVNCHLILRDIAHALQYVHNKCLLHGRLDPSSVAKFLTKWKLLDIGSATEMGNAMGGVLRRSIPPEAVVKTRTKGTGASVIGKKVKVRRTATKDDVVCGGSSVKKINNSKAKIPTRKKFGVFVFNMDELGLHQYGNPVTNKQKCRGTLPSESFSKGSTHNDTANTDDGSLRIITMQEDEIARLRKALDEKEHVYRMQIVEERASNRLQEIERLRDKSVDHMGKNIKIIEAVRFVPEKVMALPSWDVWGLGLIMAELLLGKSTLLPCHAATDAEFMDDLAEFNETKVAAISEDVRDVAGDLAADLILRLLHPEPQKRISSISKILQHKYFHESVELSIDEPVGRACKNSRKKVKKIYGKFSR